MPGCSALLFLVWGSQAVSHPVFWTSSSTSGFEEIIRNMERTRMAGKNMDEITLKGNYQPKRNNNGILVLNPVSRDVSVRPLLPNYYCWFHFSKCPPNVLSTRRSQTKEEAMGSLDARSGRALVEQAVLQALGGRYMAGYKSGKQEDIHQGSRKSRIEMLLL